jgi:cytochrome c biogenesis protein CcmG, thiol:disulfide interchange protein DsbE
MTEPQTSTTPPPRRPYLMALPLLLFAALAVLLWLRLGNGDPSKIPSALIGRPAPQTALPPLKALIADGAPVPGLDPAMFKGKVSIVNVWASWCVPCHDEAPLLTELAKDKRLQLVGINYKDAPDKARRFLGRYGNPFGIVGVDGKAAPRSNGASMACRRPLSSGARGRSSTGWSVRSRLRISTACSGSRSTRR